MHSHTTSVYNMIYSFFLLESYRSVSSLLLEKKKIFIAQTIIFDNKRKNEEKRRLWKIKMWFVTNLCKCLISFLLNFPTFLWLGTFSQLLLFESILNGNQFIRTLLELYSLGPLFPSSRVLRSRGPDPTNCSLETVVCTYVFILFKHVRILNGADRWLLHHCRSDEQLWDLKLGTNGHIRKPTRTTGSIWNRGTLFQLGQVRETNWSPKFKFHKSWGGLIINDVSCCDPHCQLNANPSRLHNGDFWHYWGTRLLSALLNRVNKVGAY